MKSFLCKWADMLSILLEVSYKALDSAEFEGLLCGVAFKLKAALQVSVSEVVHEGADDGGHQVLFCDQHPRLENITYTTATSDRPLEVWVVSCFSICEIHIYWEEKMRQNRTQEQRQGKGRRKERRKRLYKCREKLKRGREVEKPRRWKQ